MPRPLNQAAVVVDSHNVARVLTLCSWPHSVNLDRGLYISVSSSGRSDTHDRLVPRLFCRACASPLVQVTAWEQETRSAWKVRIVCPECGSEHLALLDHRQLVYLSLAVEEGFAFMLEALAEIQDLVDTPPDGRNTAGLDLVDRACRERIEPVTP